MKTEFYLKYKTSVPKGLPKYAELREIIRSAIMDEYWKNGEKIPNERKISDITPFSLGTVQKAFRDLVSEGVVERRQGHGSFVSLNKTQMTDPWHFRFSEGLNKEPLKVYPNVRFKKKVIRQNTWAKLLEPTEGRLIQIDRTVAIEDRFKIYSKFYLSEKKFERLIEKSNKELESENIKTILHHEFNVHFSNISQTFQCVTFPDQICEPLEVESGTTGMLMEIFAYSNQKRTIYYQKVYIPPNDLKLIVTDSVKVPDLWR